MKDYFIQFAPVMNDGTVPFLLDAAIKSTLLLAIAYLAAMLLRRASAAVRHRVWCLTFMSLLGLPVLSLILPGWRLPILPYPADARTASIKASTPEIARATATLSKPYQPAKDEYDCKRSSTTTSWECFRLPMFR